MQTLAPSRETRGWQYSFMRTFSARKEIGATPTELWPLIGDLLRHGEWSADPLDVTPVGPNRYASRVRTRGKTFNAQIEVLTSTPEELFEFRVKDETGAYTHRIGLAELEAGTMVTRQVTPDRLSLGQQVLATAAKVPIRIPSLQTSLDRLAERVEISI